MSLAPDAEDRTESCRICGSVVRRPIGDRGPAFCSAGCETRWRRQVATGQLDDD